MRRLSHRTSVSSFGRPHNQLQRWTHTLPFRQGLLDCSLLESLRCVNKFRSWRYLAGILLNQNAYSLLPSSKPCERPRVEFEHQEDKATTSARRQNGGTDFARLFLILKGKQAKVIDNERIRTAAAEAIRFRGVPVNHSGTLPF